MRILRIIVVLVVVLLVGGLVQAEGQAAEVNSYWKRINEGFANPVVVYEYVYEYRSDELEITARIPQLTGTLDASWQAEFNESLREQLTSYKAELEEIVSERLEMDVAHHNFVYEGIIDFEVQLNHGGLLSLAIISYSYTGGAHGMTYYNYKNIDLTTGHEISFYDVFSTEEELARAAATINQVVSEGPEWYFIDEFTTGLFTADQGFYLKDDQVVVSFGLYEIAPYAAGIQEFAIPAP